MQTVTLRKTEGADAGQTEKITLPSQNIVRATNGETIVLPFNQFGLYDTRDIAPTTLFFQPSPQGPRTENNYSTMPPNSSEPTIITALGLDFTSAIIRSDATNGIDALALVNAVTSGVLQIRQDDDNRILVEDAAARFMDLSNVAVDGDVVTIAAASKPVRLTEAVYVPQGIRYIVELILGAGADIPTDAEYAASGQRKVRLRARAIHHGKGNR